MKIETVSNLRWNNAEQTSFDCTLSTAEFGDIPFTATAADMHGHGIYEKGVAGELGEIAAYVAPTPTAEELLAEKKRLRTATVGAITVTTTSGKVFDGNEKAQDRMARAVIAAGITGQSECTWVLANNVPTTVTLAELKEAMALSLQAMGAVWVAPYIG